MTAESTRELVRIGMSEARAAAVADSLGRCDSALDKRGVSQTRWSIWVPGRVELFGKHTDYAGGRSILCATERGFAVRCAARRDGNVVITDVILGEEAAIGRGDQGNDPPHWVHYISTVCRRLAHNFPSATRGADIAFVSDLPRAAGLSSSSALMISVFVALAKANDLRSSAEFRSEIFTREELATYLSCIENGESFRSLEGDRGVGTSGGSQDHVAIMASEAGRFVQYSFSPVRREASYSLPKDHVLVVGFSGVSAEKTGGAMESYNSAAALVKELLDRFNVQTGRGDTALAQAMHSSSEAVSLLKDLAAAMDAEKGRGERVTARLEQFLLESEFIIPAVATAMGRGSFKELGSLAARSHEAAAQGVGNQIAETDALALLARELGAVAASPFGAGFGGSVWALVARDAAERFVSDWEAGYTERFPDFKGKAEFFVTAAGPPAHQW